MNKFSDRAGRRFGRWTVIALHSKPAKRHSRWLCKCDCGTIRDVDLGNLINGGTKSCGCLSSETARINGFKNKKHGLVGTSIYKTWDSMKQRVDNKNHKSFKDYGGRGILICPEIRKSPESLIALIGERPDRSFSIDRIDNAKHYSCGQCSFCRKRRLGKNVKWSTMKQQCRNRRGNRILNGKTLAEIVDISGLTKSLIYARAQRGETGSDLFIEKHERVPIRRLASKHGQDILP